MRVKITFFCFIGMALVLVFRLYVLQIQKGDYYSALALGQYVSFSSDVKQRGEIFFANKEKVAISQPSRFYPKNDLASHILGFINKDNQGQYGIEGFYNDLLVGKSGLPVKIKSPFGYVASFFDFKEESAMDKGCDIYLTIDYNLQYFSEKLLKKAFDDWQIEKGQIIIANPQTGAILALAVFPGFDPNTYGQIFDLAVFTNSALLLFEPGSIFKPITIAAALEEGVINRDTEYFDNGFVEAGGPAIRNYDKRAWGTQTMEGVLEKSINTGAVFVQQRLGKKRFLDYVKKFGFFEKTEIDLQGEVSSKNNLLQRGYVRDLATASFGQGIQVTPIQTIRAFSVLANGGNLVKPYIVEKIVDDTGKEIITEPEIQSSVISNEVSRIITAMMVNVVDRGFSQNAGLKGYSIAGKTGTAQIPLSVGGYEPDDTIHSFIGYFPAFEPQFLVLVKLDRPKGVKTASASSAKIFGELAKYIVDFYRIPPDVVSPISAD